MADASPRRTFVDRTGYVHASLERLLASMVESSRSGAKATLRMTPYGADWSRLERAICHVIERRLEATTALDDEALALIRRTDRALRQDADEAFRGPAYVQGINLIDDARAAGLGLLPPEVVAAQIFPAVVWYSVWHLIGASLPVSAILGVISPPTSAYDRPPPSPTRPQLRSTGPTRPPPKPTVVDSPDPLGRLGEAATLIVARIARGVAHAVRMVRDTANSAAQAKKVRAEAVEAARQASLASTQTAQSQAPPDRHHVASMPPARTAKLDGDRMRGPVFGTWLMLVILSWVALVWGAILAVPFVGPFGILGAMMGGFITVPLWGTLWGFIGMGMARDSTLTHMGFKPAQDGDWLSVTTAGLARQLDLPPPSVGTIPAFNAFAMGSDHRHATVAIGTPLMEHLSREEVAAVIGHELGHVVSGDMRKMMLMRTFQNACVWYMFAQGLKQFARWIIGWAAELAILAFSRRREYWADAVGAALTSKEAMIGALRKLEHGPERSASERTHARFMFRGSLSTHPTIAQRVAALEAETYLKRLPTR